MTNSTLGGLIKDYRLQKGISQLDIAFSLGWKEPSRLSRIEQGKTEKPPREIIDKIASAIGLEDEEKNTLLLTGSYLPNEEEIEKARKETEKVLREWPYPGTVIDFSWRVISQNQHNLTLYGINSQQETLMNKYHPRVLDLLFSKQLEHNKLVSGEEAENWRKFLKVVVLNFKYEQRHRTKEKWFIESMKKLMDNKLFRDLWVETSINDRLDGVIGKSATTRVVCAAAGNKVLNFFLFVVPVLKDPRFEMELLIPRDLETYSFYHTSSK